MPKTMYDKREFSLAELLEESTHNASILIPDLQRPYVWSPEQIVLLVDSLFRGWPFGTLLTWTVKAVDTQEEGIPSRTFYTFVDRAETGKEKTATRRAPSYNTYDTLILDGQQRLQSLILALGESDGIRMYDSSWEKYLHPSSKARSKSGFTTASLCLDLDKYLSEMVRCSNIVSRVELANNACICWAVVNEDLCSATHYRQRLPLKSIKDGGLIALKSLWAKADHNYEDSDQLQPLAKEFVEGAFPSEEARELFYGSHGGSENVIRDVAKFLFCLCLLKNPNLKITALNITPFKAPMTATSEEEKIKAKQEYDDAIVGIFTRLNTAGRALTREEITFAWLKSTWNDVGIAGGNYPKAEMFVEELQKTFTIWGASADDIVHALSILWCVRDSERRGLLLEDRELLQAGIIRKMSKFLRENADAIIDAAKSTKDLYEDGHLTTVSDSFNGVAIAWALYFTGEKTRRRITQSATEHEKDNSKKTIRDIVRFFLARWAVLPSWAGKWATRAQAFLGQVSATIAASAARLDSAEQMNELGDELTKLSQTINGNNKNDALSALQLPLRERTVFLYRSRLEIWQGLDQDRARFRMLTFKDANARSEVKLQVDHIVAHDAWKDRIERAFADGTLTVDAAASILCGFAEDEIARQKFADIGVYEKSVRERSVGFINSIGNCMLLNAGYNISKRKKQLGDFMDNMYEFQHDTHDALRVDRSAWMNAMKLTDVLVYPNRHSIEEIAEAVRQRETEIYGELERFVSNPKPVLF